MNSRKTATPKRNALKLQRWEISLGDVIGPELLGPNDSHIRYLEQYFVSTFSVRGNKLLVNGPVQERELIETVFRDLLAIRIDRKESVLSDDVKTAVALASERHQRKPQEPDLPPVATIVEENAMVRISPLLRKPIQPRSKNQYNYLELIHDYSIVFATGPAGSGKTYLAVAAAVTALLEGDVERIILVRPAVEAGEHLGFLPGDLKEKVDPYFRPIYDALMDMLPAEKLKRMLYSGMIEIAPLAYMRGRTLSNAFVILDEAQNTTSAQMKMFLTRIGRGSHAVITGDLTQIDLPNGVSSGLPEALSILDRVSGIAEIELSSEDIVRHGLVIEIVEAYNRQKRLRSSE